MSGEGLRLFKLEVVGLGGGFGLLVFGFIVWLKFFR